MLKKILKIKENILNPKTFFQAFKFGLVGVLNTAVCFVVIFFCLKILKFTYVVSNVLGYMFGFINSFVFNKIWTFKSRKNPLKESLFFILVFIISYLIQLGFLVFFKKVCGFGVEISQIISMVIYTFFGFIGNKLITFREKKSDEELQNIGNNTMLQ
ncbi:MAG TPA: GtrA family protein [Spirochaetota bacterium]|nr:GtrA family protein [Spirochaetota bacterium]